jgi:hypothetical protein
LRKLNSNTIHIKSSALALPKAAREFCTSSTLTSGGITKMSELKGWRTSGCLKRFSAGQPSLFRITMTDLIIETTVRWVEGHKQFLGGLSVGIGALAYGIYIWQIAKKGIRPHPLSWILWSFVSGVATWLQWAKGAGPGYWVTLFTALVCFIIGVIALFLYEPELSLFEQISFATGVVAVAFMCAKDPRAAAAFATIADVIGYIPTIKKGWVAPHTDSVTSFALNSIKFIPALLALNAYSVATWLYPATLVIVNGGVAVMLAVRRRTIPKVSDESRVTAP